MSDEDVYSLVVYLNTLTPVRNPVPRSKIVFPVSMLMRGAPQPAGHVPEPDRSNKLKYGEYLVTMAGCMECHTPAKHSRSCSLVSLSSSAKARITDSRSAAAPQSVFEAVSHSRHLCI